MPDARPVVSGPLRYAGSVACAVAILVASLVDPGEAAGRTLLGQPVTMYLHVLWYAVFTVMLCYAMLADDGRALLVAALVVTTYGVVVEFLQGTLPYRTMDPLDALLNAIGAGAGAITWQRAADWVARRS